MLERSAVVEHEWKNHHLIHLEETVVLDHGRRQQLLVKEALHIQMTPSERHFNRDGGLKVSGTVKHGRRGGGTVLLGEGGQVQSASAGVEHTPVRPWS